MTGLRRQYRFTCVPEQLIRDSAVSDRAVRLWALLDRYAAGAEATMPSRRELSDDLVCSLDSIDRALGELRKGGWLKVNQYVEDGRKTGKPSEYVLVDIPARGAARVRHPYRKGAAPPAAAERHPGEPDLRERRAEKGRGENPPTPPTGVGGNREHRGQHKRCRPCGTAGRPKCDPKSPLQLSERCRAGDGRNCTWGDCYCPHHQREVPS